MWIFISVLCQLKEVLHKQATVEAFTEWLDATLNQRVVKVGFLLSPFFIQANSDYFSNPNCSLKLYIFIPKL